MRPGLDPSSHGAARRHPRRARRLLPAPGNLVSDAHLAALAIEHGLTVCSADTDFARFREIQWVNPLAPP